MVDTKLASVPSWILSELLDDTPLAPLRSRYAVLPYLNATSINGRPGGDRKITKRDEVAEAVEDLEATEFTEFEELTEGTPITSTPTKKVQGIKTSIDVLQQAFPGMTRAQVIAIVRAIENAQPGVGLPPDSLPMLRYIVEEILDAHYRPAERAGLASFAGLAETAGATNTALDFLALIDGQTTLFETNKPSHRTIACFIGAKGIGDLRTDMLNGDAAASALFSNGYGEEFLRSLGGAAPSAMVPFGNILGMPIIEADSDLMTEANAGVDKVGGIVCVGKGKTGAPGSLRGFAEFTEGYDLEVGMRYDLESDMVIAIGRWSWTVIEHTDEHGVGLVYKKT
jgi:hypothetical protein